MTREQPTPEELAVRELLHEAVKTAVANCNIIKFEGSGTPAEYFGRGTYSLTVVCGSKPARIFINASGIKIGKKTIPLDDPDIIPKTETLLREFYKEYISGKIKSYKKQVGIWERRLLKL